MIFGQPCTHFVLAYMYFCLFNFQLRTNKNVVVVVVLLPLVQKWTSYKCWHFQLVMSSDLVKLYTDDRIVKSSKNSPSTLWCHMSAELFTAVADSSTKYCKISCLHIELLTSTLCDHLVGNIVYTSTTDSYDDLMWLYFYFL